jgi:uncharacterized protein (DUF58 family)
VKRLLLSLSLLAGLVGAATAGESAAETTPAATVFGLASLEHDFGRVKCGEPLSHTFVLTNQSSDVLLIEDVKPSCGCTKGDFDKRIEPGKSGKITLSVAKTEKYSGPTLRTAVVTTNDPLHKTVTLSLRADFIPLTTTTANATVSTTEK